MANNAQKNDAKMCENDTMLLQETLLQQKKICFLWNSKRKKKSNL